MHPKKDFSPLHFLISNNGLDSNHKFFKNYPSDGRQKNLFSNLITKNKSKSNTTFNVGKNFNIQKRSKFGYTSLNSKKTLHTEKSEEKERSVGKNLENYKLKKIEQRIKITIDNENQRRQQNNFILGQSPRGIRVRTPSKLPLSARKNTEKSQGELKYIHPQTVQKNFNLEIDTRNIKQFCGNKNTQNIPQTTKTITYNKGFKQNKIPNTIRQFEQFRLEQKNKKTLENSIQKQSQVSHYHYQYDLMTNHPTQKREKQTRVQRPDPPRNLSINDFDIIKALGKGQNGKIYQSIHKKTGAIYALKHFQPKQKTILNYLIDQMKIQLFCEHPNIVPAYGYIIEKAGMINTEKSYYNIYIVMEIGQENLFKYIQRQKKLTQDQAASFTEQILSGLLFLHENKIIHRDLKPENIILVNGVCKITDFGWSVIGSQQRETFCGTLEYVSPEVATGRRYDNKIDVWSVGILIFEMITGAAPYDSNNILQNPTQQFRKRILSRLPNNISQQCRQLLLLMLRINPHNRVSLEQALQHKWISQYGLRKTVSKKGANMMEQMQRVIEK